jgi:hypothetical protein
MERHSLAPDGPVCYRRRQDVSIEEVAGETLVLDDAAGCLHRLNPTASFIWSRCDGQTSVAEIIRQMSDHFDVNDKVAEKDVAQVVTQLRGLNLLTE